MKTPLGKSIRNKFSRFMDKEELYRILRYCQEYSLNNYELIFMIAGMMGLRAIEVLTIQLQDISRDLEKLTVRLAKTDKILTRYIPDQIKEKLYIYIKKYQNQIIASGGYLFFTFNPMSKAPHLKPSSVNMKLSEISDKLGLGDFIVENGIKVRRIGMHSLRRLFASELHKQTKDICIVRDVLGHSRADTTSTYLKAIQFDEQQKEVEKLARNLIKPTPVYTNEDQLQEIITEKIKEIFTGILS